MTEQDEKIAEIEAALEAAENGNFDGSLAISSSSFEFIRYLLTELKREREARRRLLIAAKDADRVMGKYIYPKPDVRDDHPYAVLCRLQAAISDATPPTSSGLSDFIRNASPEEKERVYNEVIDRASERQREAVVRDCENCEGYGTVWEYTEQITCPDCNGTGRATK